MRTGFGFNKGYCIFGIWRSFGCAFLQVNGKRKLFVIREARPGGREGAGRSALKKGFPGLLVSDAETLSLQESA